MKQTILLDPKEGGKEGGEGGYGGGETLGQLEDFGGMGDLGEYDILEELFERCEKADSQPLSPTPSAPERTVHSNSDADPSAPLASTSPKKRYRRTLKEVKHPKPDVPRPRNAWIIYRSHKSKELRAAATTPPNSRFISATVSDMWRQEPQHVKDEFLAMADDEKKMHSTLWPEYKFKPRRPTVREMRRGSGKGDSPTPRTKKSEERSRGRPCKSHSRSQSDDLAIRYPLNGAVAGQLFPMAIPMQANPPLLFNALPMVPASPVKGLQYPPDFLASPASSYPGSQPGLYNSPQHCNTDIPMLEHLPTDFNFDGMSDLFADIESLLNQPQDGHSQASSFFNVSQDLFK